MSENKICGGCGAEYSDEIPEHLKNSNLIFGAHYIKVENCRLYSTATTYWIDENLDHSLEIDFGVQSNLPESATLSFTGELNENFPLEDVTGDILDTQIIDSGFDYE
ncbi:MAG TPA: hypothetical protein VGD05_00480 [Pyrinomonadaceae bacterium]